MGDLRCQEPLCKFQRIAQLLYCGLLTYYCFDLTEYYVRHILQHVDTKAISPIGQYLLYHRRN
jgi:hypothetical protein